MPTPRPTLQDEVVNSIRNQPIGSYRVTDLNLPEEYLRKVADRVLRTAFEKEFRLVVRDAGDQTIPATPFPTPATERPNAAAIRVVDHVESATSKNWRDSLIEARPEIRGFRAPLLDQRDQVWPMFVPESLTTREKTAADWLAVHLAADGLIPTLAAVIDLLESATNWQSVTGIETLKSIGMPVDLLAYFRPPGQDREQPLISWVRGLVRAGDRKPDHPVFREAQFAFRASAPGFRLASETGEHDVSAIRLQLTRAGYWDGPGDGGNLDLIQQVVTQLPHAKVFIHVESRMLNEARLLVESWNLFDSGRVTLIGEPRIVSQWAQDNGKPGLINDQPVTIVPRFASRGEDGSTFVPGDTFLLDGFRDAGATVIQSPLLFHGGNLLAVRCPQTGERVLLVGEAEIHRNTGLGLSRQQVIDAFRIEFGVDRCEVLPATSFHLDYDVCMRAIGSRIMAFVNDDLEACRIILECGVGAMVRNALIDPSNAEKALRRMQRRDYLGCLDVLGPAIGAFINARGQLPFAVAEKFSLSRVDSGVGNAHRFMLAIDLLIAISTPPAKLSSIDSHGYYAALARNEQDTTRLHQSLVRLGYQVVKVPSLTAGDRSVTAINGVHLQSAYLMPCYGGLYDAVDAAAKAVFEKHLGVAVPVIPIRSGESQRRNGAVHCSVSILPLGSAGNQSVGAEMETGAKLKE